MEESSKETRIIAGKIDIMNCFKVSEHQKNLRLKEAIVAYRKNRKRKTV